MTTGPAARREFDEINVSDLEFWARSAADRERCFAILRAERPVSWQPPHRTIFPQDPNVPDPGYWAVVRHADIVEVSRRIDDFVSGEGVMFDTFPQEVLEATLSFLAMDAPQHTKLRRLVSAAFTPRQIALLEAQIAANAMAVVRELADAGSGADFVEHCAGQLPLRTLSDMIGIPGSERGQVAKATETLLSTADPDFLAGREPVVLVFEAQSYLHQLAQEMAEDRHRNPRDDLMTSLVQAEVDGERLSTFDIGAFFTLLAVAANDTTRQTASHALHALTLFPEQRAWLMEDLDGRIGGAVEELVRWATPVMTFRRTAAADVRLGGQEIRAGDKVVMYYTSGNRDTEVFTAPESLDLGRDPNPHVAFGGGRPHFCLGSRVARTQLRVLFRELMTRLPGIRAGEPEYLVSAFVHGIRTMPWTF
jgi:cytochrome P450